MPQSWWDLLERLDTLTLRGSNKKWDTADTHFIKGLNPAVHPAGHLCWCAWAAGDHRDPVESQHRWPSTGQHGLVLGKKEHDRWTGGQPHLPAVPGWHASVRETWITAVKECSENQDLSVSFHITNCQLMMTPMSHSQTHTCRPWH